MQQRVYQTKVQNVNVTFRHFPISPKTCRCIVWLISSTAVNHAVINSI